MSTTPTSALARLGEIVGSAGLSTDPNELARYEVDGLRPAAVAQPSSAEEVAGVVRFAAAENLAVIPASGRTKLRIGAPPRRYDLALDLTRLNRVLAYDPGDLTLGVEPGMRFADLDAVLAEKGQFLPLAPAFADQATMGGIVATNAGTPLRYAYGSARDYVLGVEFVTGDGTHRKSGGRVVKNVTGYDLHKLMIGALGTLGVMTRINFKTFPRSRAERTFVASFPRAAGALEWCRAIRQSPLSPRLVEMLDPAAAKIVAQESGRLPAAQWSVVVAAAGHERVVERHATELARLAETARAAGFAALGDAERSALLERIREFPKHILESSSLATILRIGVLPTHIEALLERARQTADQHELPMAALIHAVGIVYLILLPPASGPEVIRQLASAAAEIMQLSASPEIGGHAVIEWCPTELKREVNVWGATREDFLLIQELKKVFDPQGILSPGRFLGGI